ncbi:hypothetical protein SAMN02982917_6997 [Azospirillum oryzae]|uniref:Uncharacterized protein n=1 Tax=Azospirillum oryzae TaxID=286727 RepID=A0A1X7HQ42_9PROT|nr:hypothetical protein SAMN02982917_6997 [Azospirillum oryzae]
MRVLAAAVMSLSAVLSVSLFTSVFIQESLANGSLVLAGLPSAAEANAPSLTITRSGSILSGKAPADHFTGSAWIDRRFQAPTPARGAGASVPFELGARTA